ncbi:MAG TPA: hypothetical protein VK781_05070 [Solirubrobacteraceae bacterium]|jgi:hypothetical protein|nr:hypothetical protein [Solirubrobacteraceae bacterium]
MIEFLQSIKSDLLSRRLLPLLALFGVALIAAVGYAVTGGSSGSAPTPVASSPSVPAVVGTTAIPVSVAPVDPNEAVSETPGGVRYQSHGPTRDPFIPLPSPAASTTTSSAPSGSGSSGSASGGSSAGSTGSTGSSSGGSSAGGQKAPAPAPAPKKPAKPQFPYIVSVLFGAASSTPGQPATLTPYENLKLLQPLPSKQDARISFERVTTDAKGAVFKLLTPPILHGSAICLPTTSECQTIDLEAGHSEELEYIEASGLPVVYELKVVSIARKSGDANAARVKHSGKLAQTMRRAGAAQAIGKASALRLSRNSRTGRAKRN